MTVSGSKLIHRLRANKPLSAKTEGGAMSAARIGTRDLGLRLQDMAKDGIDAEIVFPSLALWTYVLEDPELELATACVRVWFDRVSDSLALPRFEPVPGGRG